MATKLLYLPDVAERLGRPVRTIEWLVQTKAIPSGKIAGRRVVREADLDAYIESAFEASA
jgi:excisionase family DNA binding protein